MTTPSTRMGADSRRVSIESIDGETAFCKDAIGRIYQLVVSFRPKGTAIPAVGELWLIERGDGYPFRFTAQIGAQTPSVITGSRTGLHPVMLQVLNALDKLGLVDDQTSP